MTDHSSALDGITQDDLANTETSSSGPYDQASLQIDENGVVEVLITTLHGGDMTSMEVHNGCVLSYQIGANADLETLKEALADGGSAAMLIEQVVAGHSIEWNGRNNVGVLTENGRTASEQLDALLTTMEPSNLTHWNADSWLLGSQSVEAMLREINLPLNATPAAIKARAAELVAQARADNVLVDAHDIETTLLESIEAHRAACAADSS